MILVIYLQINRESLQHIIDFNVPSNPAVVIKRAVSQKRWV